MLPIRSLQNPTELRVALSILWEHFDGADAGSRAGEAVHLRDDSIAPSAEIWNIVIPIFFPLGEARRHS